MRVLLLLTLLLACVPALAQSSGNRIIVLSGTTPTLDWSLQKEATYNITANSVVTMSNIPTSTVIKTTAGILVNSAGGFDLGFTFPGSHTTNWLSNFLLTPHVGQTYYLFEQYGTVVQITADPAFYPTANGQVLRRMDGTNGFGLVHYTPSSTPAQITSDQNNYNPTGLSTSYRLRLSSDTNRVITGFQSPAQDGKPLWAVNVGSFNIELAHQNTSSSTTNRMVLAGAKSVIIAPGCGYFLYYSSSDGRWHDEAPSATVTTVGATWAGNGSALTTGKAQGYATVPYTGKITGYSISADTGTCTIQTWKVANGTAVPTVANTISTSGVSLSSGTHVRSSTVSDFTTVMVQEGDILAFNLGTVASATQITFQLEISR